MSGNAGCPAFHALQVRNMALWCIGFYCYDNHNFMDEVKCTCIQLSRLMAFDFVHPLLFSLHYNSNKKAAKRLAN